MATTTDSTIRTASIPATIRNMGSRIALLVLRRVNGTISPEERAELDQLQKRLDKLNKQLTIEKYTRTS